jgi:hypothetical protein
MDNKKKDGPHQPQPINIKVGPVEGEGIYSNLAIISHSTAEFIIDFTRLLPGIPDAKVHARIIMTPQHVKLLMQALTENVRKFEQTFGEIKCDGNVNTPPSFPFGFSGLPN